MKNQIGTIDLTPTWASALEVYIGVLTNPRAKAEYINGAIEDLRRMANLADAHVASKKDAA